MKKEHKYGMRQRGYSLDREKIALENEMVNEIKKLGYSIQGRDVDFKCCVSLNGIIKAFNSWEDAYNALVKNK